MCMYIWTSVSGNDIMHDLTTNGSSWLLRSDMEIYDDDRTHGYAEFESFLIEPESDNYRLRVDNYIGGNAGRQI